MSRSVPIYKYGWPHDFIYTSHRGALTWIRRLAYHGFVTFCAPCTLFAFTRTCTGHAIYDMAQASLDVRVWMLRRDLGT